MDTDLISQVSRKNGEGKMVVSPEQPGALPHFQIDLWRFVQGNVLDLVWLFCLTDGWIIMVRKSFENVFPHLANLHFSSSPEGPGEGGQVIELFLGPSYQS